jgi:hypothetical protein
LLHFFSGVGLPKNPTFGVSEEGRAILSRLVREAAKARRTGTALATAEEVDEGLADKLVQNVVANWDPLQLDFEVLENTDPGMSPEYKAKACYTYYAFFRELQSLPEPDRLKYLRSAFGESDGRPN